MVAKKLLVNSITKVEEGEKQKKGKAREQAKFGKKAECQLVHQVTPILQEKGFRCYWKFYMLCLNQVKSQS